MEAVRGVPGALSSVPYALHYWRISLRIPACVLVVISLILQCVDSAQCMQAVGYYLYLEGEIYDGPGGCWLWNNVIISIPIVGSAYIILIIYFCLLAID